MKKIISSTVIAGMFALSIPFHALADVSDKVTNLHSQNVTDHSISIAWTGNPNAYGYKVYRNTVEVASTANVDYNTYDDYYALDANTSYTYKVSTLDINGNEIANVEYTENTLNDVTPPSNVMVMVPYGKESNPLSFSFYQSGADMDFDHINVYRNDKKAGEVTGDRMSLKWTDVTALDNTTYHYIFKSVDKSGNESTGTDKFTNGEPIEVHSPDLVPLDVFNVSIAQIGSKIHLSWKNPVLNDLSQIIVFDQENHVLATLSGSVNSIDITKPFVDNQLITFKIVTKDTSALVSEGVTKSFTFKKPVEIPLVVSKRPFVIAKENIAVFEGASPSSKVIGKLSLGAVIYPIGDAVNGFFRISYNGKIAFISKSYALGNQEFKQPQIKKPVSVSTDELALSVRLTPSPGAPVIGVIKKGTSVLVEKEAISGGWYKVSYNGVVGYVAKSHTFVNDKTKLSNVKITVKTTSSLTVRSTASSKGTPLGTLKKGVKITIQKEAYGDWYKMEYNGKISYINRYYVTAVK